MDAVNEESNLIDDTPSANVDEVADMMVPLSLANKAIMNMIHLNDDCLLEIFKNRSLTVMDLCTLAETCQRFRDITQTAFPKRFGIITPTLHGDYEFVREKYVKFYCEKKDVARILKHFGSRLDELTIHEKQIDFVHTVAKHCHNITLKRLELHHVNNVDVVNVLLESSIQQLLVLSVNNCFFKWEDNKFFKMNCDSLTELEVNFTSSCFAILCHHFPNLQRFLLRCSYGYPRLYLIHSSYRGSYYTKHFDKAKFMLRFVRRHNRLKVLHIHGSTEWPTEELVQTLGEYNKELEDLIVQDYQPSPRIDFHVVPMVTLPKLRKLDVCITTENYNYIVALLQASSSLETVTLWSLDEVTTDIFDLLLQQQSLHELNLQYFPFHHIPIKKFTKLRRLRVHESGEIKATDLFSVIRDLEHLEMLDVCSKGDKFILNERDFGEIVKIVKGRSNVLTLDCECDKILYRNTNEKHNVILKKVIDSCGVD